MHKTNNIVGISLVSGAVALVLFTHFWPVPATLNLAIPFTDQAPTGRWDRNEDCEETSITMANAYLNGNRDDLLPPAVAAKYIASLKQWEGANIGYNADTGAYATSRMAEGTFGITVRQIKNYTERDLKRALARHHVVLLPIDARQLKSQQYTNSGPTYHMIVVRGYTETGFIINDPGTSAGNGMVYPFATLQSAAADWNSSSLAMDSTIKIALILSK